MAILNCREDRDKEDGMWNPRYLKYCEANGNTPEEQLAADKVQYPGGCMCGYMRWVDEAWREFLVPFGGNKLDLPIAGGPVQDRFDEFLDEREKADDPGFAIDMAEYRLAER